jgi:alanine dehydrogenase
MIGQCVTLMSSPAAIRDVLPMADLVVGAVLVPGSKTPTLITREMLGTMKKGAVLVDVSIDQGGCFETSRETNCALCRQQHARRLAQDFYPGIE